MIYLGADHGGFELKEKIKEWLDGWNMPYVDCGALAFDPHDDYPQFAFAVAQKVGSEDDRNKPWADRAKGILVCRSAGGVIIAANKIKAVRAVAVTDITSARHAREHNDANIIGLSGDWLTEPDAREVIHTWLVTEYTHEPRHERRIRQIEEHEKTP